MSKTDNGRGALAGKVELRERVLELVPEARVFDAFCGTGQMHDAVWQRAASYVGCDEREWSTSEHFKRFVADNRIVMRAIDLQAFNVFDFDAYGAPWEQMIILAARRKWSPGEVGAVVLTDGSSMRLRYGSLTNAMAELLGTARGGLPRTDGNTLLLQQMVLRRWCERARVKALHCFRSTGKGSGRGGQKMTYVALVFEGVGASGAKGAGASALLH